MTNWCVYTLFNPGRYWDQKEGTSYHPWLYTGCTDDLDKRIHKHRTSATEGAKRTRGRHQNQWRVFFYVSGLTEEVARQWENRHGDPLGIHPDRRLKRLTELTISSFTDESQPKLVFVYRLSKE